MTMLLQPRHGATHDACSSLTDSASAEAKHMVEHWRLSSEEFTQDRDDARTLATHFKQKTQAMSSTKDGGPKFSHRSSYNQLDAKRLIVNTAPFLRIHSGEMRNNRRWLAKQTTVGPGVLLPTLMQQPTTNELETLGT